MNAIDWRNEPGEEGIVTRNDGASITLDTSIGTGWPAEAGPKPEIGDRVKILGGWGYETYGFVVNGRLRWYLTPAEREQRHQDMLAKMAADSERRYIDAEAQLDADYDALPPPFQYRIAQLRAKGGRKWRVDAESYEMFVCKEAVKMAERFRTRDALNHWYKLPYDEQRAEWDGFDRDHSGNTFGAAASLAALWCDTGLSDRAEALVARPQALAPIAGDPRYPPSPTEEQK